KIKSLLSQPDEKEEKEDAEGKGKGLKEALADSDIVGKKEQVGVLGVHGEMLQKHLDAMEDMGVDVLHLDAEKSSKLANYNIDYFKDISRYFERDEHDRIIVTTERLKELLPEVADATSKQEEQEEFDMSNLPNDQRALKVFSTRQDKVFTITEVSELTKMDYGVAGKTLRRLADKGMVANPDRGKYCYKDQEEETKEEGEKGDEIKGGEKQ
ncbi:MAG: hypothetical protein KKD12_06460, partial [Proteobacteria bacterium]|nr:hypothetical protein [Pseudomonadota bacterium]